jgi:hypothetical protein
MLPAEGSCTRRSLDNKLKLDGVTAAVTATMTPDRWTARPSGVSLPKARCVRT